MEKSFIVGNLQEPADNATPRKTQGLIGAIVTNVIDLGGSILTEEDVNDLFQLAYDNGGIQEEDTRIILVGSAMKRQLTKIFIRDVGQGFYQQSTSVGGVDLATFESDFGKASVMVDRYMPAGTLIAASLEDLAPRFLLVPGKGYFFWEPLSKTGASENSQLYGEIGLEYGNERKHAKIVDATTAYEAGS